MNVAAFSTLFLMVIAVAATQQSDSGNGQSRGYKDLIVRFNLQLTSHLDQMWLMHS